MTWSEERRRAYVEAMGYEVHDGLPEGWRYLDGSQEPKPCGLRWIARGSRFDGTYEKALARKEAVA